MKSVVMVVTELDYCCTFTVNELDKWNLKSPLGGEDCKWFIPTQGSRAQRNASSSA